MKTKTIEFKSTKGGKFSIKLPANYQKIKLAFFNKWTSALESGKYRQCTGTLCKPNDNKKLTYCCLGVLSKVQGRLFKTEHEYIEHEYKFVDGCDSDAVGELDTNNPALQGVGNFPKGVTVTDDYTRYTSSDLASCNDDLGLSFKDIAKIIKTLYKA